MPLARVKPKGQVTIPAQIRKALALEEGDYVEVSTDGKTIVLTPQAVVNRTDLEAALAEAAEDARHGRATPPFDSVKAFRAYRRSPEYKAFVEGK